MDSSGNLYGTTTGGGASNTGIVFELAQGSGTITTLATFNGTNGATSYATLMMDSGGNLYGTTLGGGANGYGTVFEVTNGPSFAGSPSSTAIFAPFGNDGGPSFHSRDAGAWIEALPEPFSL